LLLAAAIRRGEKNFFIVGGTISMFSISASSVKRNVPPASDECTTTLYELIKSLLSETRKRRHSKFIVELLLHAKTLPSKLLLPLKA